MLKTNIWLAALTFPVSSFAFDLGLITAPPSQQKYIIQYSGNLSPKAGLQNSTEKGDAGLYQESINVSIPIFRGEKDGFKLFGRYQRLNLFPNQKIQPDLYSVHLGGSYTHLLEGGKALSLSASFGSSSDKPFKDPNLYIFEGTATYSFPGSQTGYWLLLVNYSNNRPILNNIPIPGFAYTYMPSKTFRGTFGAPFAAIYWQFADRWSLNTFALVPWILDTTVSYSISASTQVFSGINFSQSTFLQYGRVNTSERIYFEERKLFVGVKSPLNKFFLGEFETGYAFDRSFFSAENYTLSPNNPTDLNSSWYGKFGITAAF
jgi:hypothetical protein